MANIITLVQGNQYNRDIYFYDEDFEAGLIIDDDVYDHADNTFKDRIYKLQDYGNSFSIDLYNSHATNSFDYSVDKTYRKFDEVGDLDSTLDWINISSDTILPETWGGSVTDLGLTAGRIQGIRIRAKETVDTNSSTIDGFVRIAN